jgi:hypothetical protein
MRDAGVQHRPKHSTPVDTAQRTEQYQLRIIAHDEGVIAMTVRSEELKDRAPAAEGKPATEHRNGHTPLRGKRPALWMSLALTAMFAPLAVTPWYFNGQLSVESLAIVYTTVIGHAPPAAVALIFQRGG